MLTIRTTQKRMFAAAYLSSLVRSTAEEVRAMGLGDARSLDVAVREERVRIAIERAASRGISTLDGLRVFALMSFDVSPRFDDEPEVAAILGDRTRSEAERFDALCEYLYALNADEEP